MRRASLPGNGGTRSCSFSSSSAMSRGSRSRRVDSIWPNFMKIGPSSSSASRSRSPREAARSRRNQVAGDRKNAKRSGRNRCVAMMISSSRWRTRTRWICSSRERTRNLMSGATGFLARSHERQLAPRADRRRRAVCPRRRRTPRPPCGSARRVLLPAGTRRRSVRTYPWRGARTQSAERATLPT